MACDQATRQEGLMLDVVRALKFLRDAGVHPPMQVIEHRLDLLRRRLVRKEVDDSGCVPELELVDRIRNAGDLDGVAALGRNAMPQTPLRITHPLQVDRCIRCAPSADR
ncbi:hypothetical protein [Variovorax sp. J31P207]|uniref:hypothetical protein n=1 Tax=Variovorax sp. J31P207 TaxID=3053510 RepID=UPI00257514D2|nr:hypothetical protein [Variovorax sp. J31P207]MDM0071460.1 hypothetical protein [Variovorax sp. J31P207]